MVMILTAVLKLAVDAATLHLLFHSKERCLRFTSAYMQYIISIFRKNSHGCLQFNEEDLKESFPCIKSAASYAAKLLNLVLANSGEASPPPAEAFYIANNLLDLITLVELYLGLAYGTRLVSSVKPWLPDLILALGSMRILTHTSVEIGCSMAFEFSKQHFPSWLSILGKLELCELDADGPDEEVDALESQFSAFKRLVELVVLLLRGNPKILDAVGVIFLSGSAVGLERGDFGLVLGLLHFVFVKLVSHELGKWEELGMMLAFLPDLYRQIEILLRDPIGSETGRKKLESAKELLEPVWKNYVYEGGSGEE